LTIDDDGDEKWMEMMIVNNDDKREIYKVATLQIWGNKVIFFATSWCWI